MIPPAPVSPSSSQPAAVASSGVRTWLLALVAGLVAGAIGWGIGEATLVPEAGYSDKAKKVEILPAELGLRNCTISFGALARPWDWPWDWRAAWSAGLIPRAIVASLRRPAAGRSRRCRTQPGHSSCVLRPFARQ